MMFKFHSVLSSSCKHNLAFPNHLLFPLLTSISSKILHSQHKNCLLRVSSYNSPLNTHFHELILMFAALYRSFLFQPFLCDQTPITQPCSNFATDLFNDFTSRSTWVPFMTCTPSTWTETGQGSWRMKHTGALTLRRKHTPRCFAAEHYHGVGGKGTKILGEITSIWTSIN